MRQEIIKLTLPIAVQNLIAFIATAVDTIMIGQLSQLAFSSVTLANQVFFIITLLVGGIAGGSNVLCAQYWGRQDKEGIFHTLAYTLRMTLVLVGGIALVCFFFPKFVLKLLTNQSGMIETGSQYLRIVSLSYLVYALSAVFTQTLRAVRSVRISMITSAVTLCVNVCLNYCFIFGNFGFPEMGVAGAALATLAARFVELALLIVYILFAEKKLKMRFSYLIPIDKTLSRLYFKTSIPVIMNELLWALGESVVVAMIGRMNENIIMSFGIYNVIAQLSNILMNGVDSAGCVLVGNQLGENGKITALTTYLQKLSLGIGIFDGMLMALSIFVIRYFYVMNDATYQICISILLVGALIEVFKSLQCMNVMGILRGSGDVQFGFFNDILFLWLYTIPVSYLALFYSPFAFYIIFFIMKSDQILKWVTSEIRCRHQIKKEIKATV